MAQAISPGVGAKELHTTTQVPTARTFETLPGTLDNLHDDPVIRIADAEDSSGDFVFTFVAPDNGRIKGIRYGNGAVAADGSNGWELAFTNVTNSSDVIAYFGFGSGTEAAKATDKDTAVSANESTELSNSDTGRFNKGDVISVTADRDGTTIVGVFDLILQLGSIGR